MRRRDLVLVSCLFILSGISGLIYEVVWLRYLSLVIGHTTFSVSLIVSAFLAGLVLGSLLFRGLADRVRRPMRLYALLEAAAGITGLGVSLLLANLDSVCQSLGLPGGGPLPVRIVMTFCLVLPPTLFMGGSLPVLSRFVARDLPRLGRHFGVLYSLNTLGAAAGCALAGFWLIAELGLLTTSILAAGINLAVAAGAVGLSRLMGPAADLPDPPAEPAPPPSERRDVRWFVIAFGLAGFVSIGYEVLWFRVLSLFLRSSVYSFTLLMVAFLLGLVLGGLLYSVKLNALRRDLELFAGAQIVLAFLGLLSLALLSLTNLITSTGLRFAFAAGVVLVPATVIGIVFPLVVQVATRQLAVTGRSVGLLYSANTIGGIIGSAALGFGIIPWLGTQGAFILVASLNVLLALGVLCLDTTADRRRWTAHGVLAMGFAVLALLFPADVLIRAWGDTTHRRVVQVAEGRDGILAVVEYSDQVLKRHVQPPARCADAHYSFRQLLFGSVSYASTILAGRRYMSTLAHLPMLSHPAPRNVLLVCFGTGVTAGAFTRYTELQSLVAVDLNREVFELAPLFAEDNAHVLEDPRTERVVDDGRHYLASTERRFDVISFEPPPPSTPGIVSMYTREFYQLVKRHLAPGGILAHWIPLQDQPDLLSRMLLETIRQEFEHVQIWIPVRNEAVILASSTPIDLDLRRWSRRWNQPAVAAALAEVGFDDPTELMAFRFLDAQALADYTAGVASIDDDMPAVEYYLNWGQGPFDREALIVHAVAPAKRLTGLADPDRLQRERDRAMLLWRAHSRSRQRDFAAARDLVRASLGDGPPDAYQRYLLELEYDCLFAFTQQQGGR